MHEFLDKSGIKFKELLSLVDLHFCRTIQNRLEPKIERKVSPLPTNMKRLTTDIGGSKAKFSKRLTISKFPFENETKEHSEMSSGGDKMTSVIFQHIKNNRDKIRSEGKLSNSPQKEDQFDLTQVTVFCKTHKCDCNTYCRDCKLLICQNCLQSDDVHSNHKLENVKVTIDKISRNLK